MKLFNLFKKSADTKVDQDTLDKGFRHEESANNDLSLNLPVAKAYYFGKEGEPYDPWFDVELSTIDSLNEKALSNGLFSSRLDFVKTPVVKKNKPEFDWKLFATTDIKSDDIITVYSDAKALNPMYPSGYYNKYNDSISLSQDHNINVDEKLRQHLLLGYSAKIKIQNSKAYWVTVPEYYGLVSYEDSLNTFLSAKKDVYNLLWMLKKNRILDETQM